MHRRPNRNSFYGSIGAASIAGLVAAHAVAQPVDFDLPDLADVPVDLEGHERGPRRPPESAPAAPATERERFGELPWAGWSRVTGDLAGARTALEDAGITLAGSYTMDWLGNVSGGIRRRGSYRHLIDANLTVDTGKLFGLVGGTVFVDFYSSSGNSISTDAGDFMGISNLDTTPSALDQVAELWYEQWLFDNVLRVKAGKVDGASEFGSPAAGAEFIHSAAGVDPTNLVLPTYPDPATSLNLFVYPTTQLYAGFGWYDGAIRDGVRLGGQGPATFFSDDRSEDWYFVGEAGVTWDQLWFLGAGRIAAGAWGHTGDFTRFDGVVESGTRGFFMLAEARLWERAPDDTEDERGLSAFVQFGRGESAVNPVEGYVGAGLSLLGTFEGRDADSTGVFLAWAGLSDEPLAGFNDDELAIEWFYKAQLTGAISVKPDVQYVVSPSGSTSTDDALVIGIRVEIAF